jgi:NAD(P)-dependent dehydrogenase (short-subunit alcohol dehydrogenase family)
MKIEGCIALVTGANRGLGKAYAEALLAAGAARVYAGARDPESVTDKRLVPVRLDVTKDDEVQDAAKLCADINLLINNAGIMLATPMLAANSEQALRDELEVNAFGILRVSRAFAPVLAIQGGGAIVNMLSVASWIVPPYNATYAASKHAAVAVTEGLRLQLKAQHTLVISVYAGFLDTDMAASMNVPKTPPGQVAERTLAALRTGKEHVLADQRAEDVWKVMRNDPGIIAGQMQTLWDESQRTAK